MSCEHPKELRTAAGLCVICSSEPALGRPELAELLASVPADVWRAEQQRRSLAAFFRAGWHVLEPTTPLAWSWHLEEVCNHVQVVIEDWARRQGDPTYVQRVRDLLVSVGPGTGKSRIGVYAIPWAWLRWPSLRAICFSANPRVALRDSMYAREVIASPWYRETFAPSWRIRDDADAKGSFVNSAGGFRNAIGIDARIVGERADLLWVDDPHDPEEATSDAQRRSVLERWDASIANRLNDMSTSVRIGIAHRVHEADWAAARIAEGWCELRLPTVFEADNACTTPIGGDHRTIDGESLHPTRLTPEVIAKEKERLGPLRWAALHQQRPAPAGGALIKTSWLRFHRAPGAPDGASLRPRGCFEGPAVETPDMFDAVCIAADLAGGKLTKTGDYNVIVAVGKKGSGFFLLDAWRARADFPEVQRQMRAFAARWPTSRKVVEAAASGSSLVSSLAAEIPGLIGQPPRGDKVSNLQAVLAFFEAGNVYLPEHWPGLADAVAELVTFPNGRHDDFVDSLRLAVASLATSASASEHEQMKRTLAMTGVPREELDARAEAILAKKYGTTPKVAPRDAFRQPTLLALRQEYERRAAGDYSLGMNALFNAFTRTPRDW
ncbi:MAG: phage terminase large subunit [Kofleriaceae bacterium]|nr:phage terminase large subunit [Kofleriaceae bacterium]